MEKLRRRRVMATVSCSEGPQHLTGNHRRQTCQATRVSVVFFILFSVITFWTEAFSLKCIPAVSTCDVRPQSQTVLFGQGRIQRGGPRDEEDDFVLQDSDEIKQEEENLHVEIPSMSMEELLSPPGDCNVNQMGPTALAYIGDNVFELMVRARHVWPTRKTADLQQQVVALVRAENQARLLEQLLESFPLTKKEEQIIKRGRNAASATRSRQNPKAYQDATAFETLLGYLYISDRQRCEELLNWIHAHLDKV